MVEERASGVPPQADTTAAGQTARAAASRRGSPEYRRDIDGLRAVAVLSVILFHIDQSILPGGFVGVDVFFVISGYLITKNTVEELDGDRFSLLEFYRRRVKRIAPALLVIVATTLVLAQVLMLPEDAGNVARSAVWSLASLANVYFWRSGAGEGYFAAESATKPLLHLWSLGVEEQFYLLWPLGLMLLYHRSRQRTFAAGVGAVALASFFLGDALFERDPTFVYYMLPTRAGELLAGALLALGVLRNVAAALSATVLSGLSLLGVVLLGVSFRFLSEAHPFPGWRALIPTLGAAALILSGSHRGNRVAQAFAHPAIRWVGLCSYSAYLWHWPLAAFYRYGFGAPGIGAGALLVGVTLALAWVSYSRVEVPARRTTAPFLRVLLLRFAVPGGVLAALAVGVVYAERIGLPLYSRDYVQRLHLLRGATRPTFLYDFVCQRQSVADADLTNPSCVLGGGADPPSALLWGDSNASQYIGMIAAFAREAGFRFRNIEVGSCPPVMEDPAPFVEARRLADCRASLDVIRPVLKSYRAVVIGASWTAYQERSPSFLGTLESGIRNLAGPDRRVILLGKVPKLEGYDRLCKEKALRFPFMTCPAIIASPSKEVLAVNAALRTFADAEPYVDYFDANAYLCPDDVCSSLSPSGKLRYFDQSHLSLDGSRELGESILARGGVPAVWKRVDVATRRATGESTP